MACRCCGSAEGPFYNLFGSFHYRHLAWIAVTVYLVVGMVVFHYIEAPNEKLGVKPRSQNEAPPQTVESMAINLTSRSNKPWQLRSSSRLDDSLANVTVVAVFADPFDSSRVVLHYIRINRTCHEPPSEEVSSKWDLAGALFFSLTVVTTIGYGNLAPATDLGKFICVVYAALGIPLFQIVLEHIRNLSIALVVCLDRKFRCPPTPRRSNRVTHSSAAAEAEEEVRNFLKKPKPGTIIFYVAGYLSLILFPSVLFSYLEHWTYLSSLYYNFISLSTIGFGDMVAGTNAASTESRYNEAWEIALYRVFLIVWLLIGLTFSAGLLEIGRLQMERVLKLFTSCCPDVTPARAKVNESQPSDSGL